MRKKNKQKNISDKKPIYKIENWRNKNLRVCVYCRVNSDSLEHKNDGTESKGEANGEKK